MIARIVAVIALAGWAWLAGARGMYWRTDVRLPRGATRPAEPQLQPWPSVAIIVPARDEVDVLPATVPTLLAQDYPGPVRVIVVDDNSTDGTGALLASWPGVTVVDPGEPPAGWAGKLWALRAGIETAGDADFLLLTDADIAHALGSLTALVRAAESSSFDLVSQMARLRAETGWERLLVPAFVYFFALLFPFRWSNRPGSKTAAAAGGCDLVRRVALERAGGLDTIHDAVIDDVALAKAIKRTGGRTYLGLADHVDSVRPYPDLGSLWRMVSRSAYAQLRYSPLLLIGTVLGLSLMFLVPLAAMLAGAIAGDAWLFGLGVAAWLLMALLYVPMQRYYRLAWPFAFLLPYTATLYLAMTVDSAMLHYRGRGGGWKGRTVKPVKI
jgi:hopene-associated glycosyltransferase HpnB